MNGDPEVEKSAQRHYLRTFGRAVFQTLTTEAERDIFILGLAFNYRLPDGSRFILNVTEIREALGAAP